MTDADEKRRGLFFSKKKRKRKTRMGKNGNSKMQKTCKNRRFLNDKCKKMRPVIHKRRKTGNDSKNLIKILSNICLVFSALKPPDPV